VRRVPGNRPLRLALAAASLAAALGACDRTPTDAASEAAAVSRAVHGITQERVAAHVAFLASDAMRGRRTPGPDLAAAAAYIAAAFRAAGLVAGGDSGGFLQPYPCTGVVTADWPANVIGLLPGSDPARRVEWVVVSAHYDHVGVGTPDARGDSIYNGADDNASGTAALLEVARALAALPKRPARSVAFVAVSGEEEGLIGSAYFVAHRPPAVAQLIADVNLDMLGRNAPDVIYLVGDSLSTLGGVAAAQATAHPELGLRPRSLNDATYLRSDQLSFAIARVPALFLHTGSHPDLHRPSDETGLIDSEKLSRAARLAFYLAYAVASDPARPAWTPQGERMLPLFQPIDATCSAGS